MLETSDPGIGFNWAGTSLTFGSKGQIIGVMEMPNLPMNQWLFAIMGSKDGVSFGVVTKKEGSQYFVSDITTLTVTSETVFVGPKASLCSKVNVGRST